MRGMSRYKFFIFLLLIFFGACNKTNTSTPNPIPLLTNFQQIVGKWYVVKDSLLVYDYSSPLSSPSVLNFNINDYIVFNKDSSITLSSQNAGNGLFAGYYIQSLYPNIQFLPNNLKGLFQISTDDSTFDIRTLRVPINSNITRNYYPELLIYGALNNGQNVDYGVISLTDSSMILLNAAIALPYPHEYQVEEYIYLHK